MLRLLFQSLEKSLGPSLSGASHLVYWAGVAALAATVLLPFWRAWVDRATGRAGLARQWVAPCPQCRQTGVVRDGACDACGATIEVPWVVRWRMRGAAWLDTPAWRHFGRFYHLAGAVGFALIVVWVVAAAGVPAPGGALRQLFLGLALLALAAAGRSLGRVLRLERRGVLARVGDGLQVLAAIGVLAATLFLAAAARPVSQTLLARFTVVGGAARIGDRLVPTSGSEVGIEYLQLDHEALGYTRIVPLAFIGGASRAPLPMTRTGRWIVGHLRAHADAYAARGLTVRVRSDRHRVTPGATYEIVEVNGQVLIRRRP